MAKATSGFFGPRSPLAPSRTPLTDPALAGWIASSLALHAGHLARARIRAKWFCDAGTIAAPGKYNRGTSLRQSSRPLEPAGFPVPPDLLDAQTGEFLHRGS